MIRQHETSSYCQTSRGARTHTHNTHKVLRLGVNRHVGYEIQVSPQKFIFPCTASTLFLEAWHKCPKWSDDFIKARGCAIWRIQHCRSRTCARPKDCHPQTQRQSRQKQASEPSPLPSKSVGWQWPDPLSPQGPAVLEAELAGTGSNLHLTRF